MPPPSASSTLCKINFIKIIEIVCIQNGAREKESPYNTPAKVESASTLFIAACSAMYLYIGIAPLFTKGAFADYTFHPLMLSRLLLFPQLYRSGALLNVCVCGAVYMYIKRTHSRTKQGKNLGNYCIVKLAGARRVFYCLLIILQSVIRVLRRQRCVYDAVK